MFCFSCFLLPEPSLVGRNLNWLPDTFCSTASELLEVPHRLFSRQDHGATAQPPRHAQRQCARSSLSDRDRRAASAIRTPLRTAPGCVLRWHMLMCSTTHTAGTTATGSLCRHVMPLALEEKKKIEGQELQFLEDTRPVTRVGTTSSYHCRPLEGIQR